MNILTPPRQIAEQFEVHGFDYCIGDGLCMGLAHDDLDSPVYIDYDEDEPNVYYVDGREAYSVEEAIEILAEILEEGNDW